MCNVCGEKGYSVYSCPNKFGFKAQGETPINKEKDLKNHYLVVPRHPQRVHYNPVGAKGQGDLMQVAVQIEGLPVIGLMDGGSTSSLGGQTLYQELWEFRCRNLLAQYS